MSVWKKKNVYWQILSSADVIQFPARTSKPRNRQRASEHHLGVINSWLVSRVVSLHCVEIGEHLTSLETVHKYLPHNTNRRCKHSWLDAHYDAWRLSCPLSVISIAALGHVSRDHNIKAIFWTSKEDPGRTHGIYVYYVQWDIGTYFWRLLCPLNRPTNTITKPKSPCSNDRCCIRSSLHVYFVRSVLLIF